MGKCDKMLEQVVEKSGIHGGFLITRKSTYLSDGIMLFKYANHSDMDIQTLLGVRLAEILKTPSFEEFKEYQFTLQKDMLVVKDGDTARQYEWKNLGFSLEPIRFHTYILKGELKLYHKLLKVYSSENDSIVFTKDRAFIIDAWNSMLSTFELNCKDVVKSPCAYKTKFVAKIIGYALAWNKEKGGRGKFDFVLFPNSKFDYSPLLGITYHEDDEPISMLMAVTQEFTEDLLKNVREVLKNARV